MEGQSLQSFLDFARQTAWEAGQITLEYYQTERAAAEYKEDDTPVTLADKRAEEHIRAAIEKTYPGHAIIGEEYGEQAAAGDATHRWIIDPIDGTKSFTRGVPLYGVLLGLEIEGVPTVGAACYPALDEILSGATGLGAWWNRQPCRVSDQTDLSRAFLAHADHTTFQNYGKAESWQRLQDAVYYNAGWCDAYGYLLVATGRVEIMVDPALKVWDCAPFGAILPEAGGYFGDWKGTPGIHGGEGLGTTQVLLEEVLRVIGG